MIQAANCDLQKELVWQRCADEEQAHDEAAQTLFAAASNHNWNWKSTSHLDLSSEKE